MPYIQTLHISWGLSDSEDVAVARTEIFASENDSTKPVLVARITSRVLLTQTGDEHE